jgi:hypothetical protein
MAHRRSACIGIYHLFAISCSDLWGDHPDDGVIPVPSALGISLGPVAERLTIHLNYGDGRAPVSALHTPFNKSVNCKVSSGPGGNFCMGVFDSG